MAVPGMEAGVCEALTTSVDLFATLEAIFDLGRARQHTHGVSLLPLLTGESRDVREHVLAGVWGREVQLIETDCKYVRAPAGANAPLAMYSNRWSTMPTHVIPRYQALPLPDGRAVLDRMPGSGVPVLRQIWEAGDAVPYWAASRFRGNHLYDLAADPGEEANLAGGADEAGAAERLAAALQAIDAPAAQFERLGL